jgi:hypothetical protein
MRLKEVAEIIGFDHGGEITRHEQLSSLPSLRAALRYEALYRAPIAKLFPGPFEEAKREVEGRLAAIIEQCKQSTATGKEGAAIARKMVWAWERENQNQGNLFDIA